MRVRFTPEQESFRSAVRAWASSSIPSGEPPFESSSERRAFDTAWQRIQWEGGFAGISWPSEHGGRGASLVEQLIFHEEMAEANAPDAGCCFVAVNHAGPTLMIAGTQDQREQHLEPILRGDQVWCQGFSEPGAGSDLASVSTRGRVDGDTLIVTGQKTWTTFANLADYCELLVRTKQDTPRPHDGLTWVILDMRAEGLDVRPIKTVVGHHHFCEVFLDDVRVPLRNVVGELHGGWQVAMATLGFERGIAFMSRQVRLRRQLDRLEALLEDRGDTAEAAGTLVQLRARADALRAMCYRLASVAEGEAPPGPLGSVLRIYYSELALDAARLALDTLGAEALVGTPWNVDYLDALRERISAGTIDIQRNIVGERLLGLPKGA